MTDKQERFINEYIIDLNATAAYKRAYNITNTATAKVNASKLLSNPNIKELINARVAEQVKDTGITANYVLTSLKKVSDRCQQAEPVLDRKGNPTGEYTFDSAGANRALELLGKHLKLFTEKIESENTNTNIEITMDDKLEDWAK